MKNDGKPFQVKTGEPRREGAIPRQPHERDESPDSQASDPREVIKQAYIDVTSGQVDTDLREQRGVEQTVKPTGKDSEQASRESSQKTLHKKIDRT
jgi:hypothetical protein